MHPRKSWRPVTPENPEHICTVLEARSKICGKRPGSGQIVEGKEPRPGAPGRSELISPNRDQGHIEPSLRSFIHDFDNAIEVFRIGPPGIVVDQRPLSQGAWLGDAVELREDNGLNDGVTLRGAGLEVIATLLARGVVDELPGCIPKPIEGPTVFILEKVTFGMHLDTGQRPHFWLRCRNGRQR